MNHKQWYLRRLDGTVLGPMGSRALLQLGMWGEVGSDDQVRPHDGDRWIPAAKVKGLHVRSSAGMTGSAEPNLQPVRQPAQPPPPVVDAQHEVELVTSKPVRHSRLIKGAALTLLLALAAAVALCVASWLWPNSESVVDYQARLIAHMNAELARKGNPICKRVEDAHVTVTATGGKVSGCAVRTIDGSQNAGVDGSNVAEYDMIVTVTWEGWVQTNGYTELEFIYDNQTHKVKDIKYLRSNALWNIEMIDWAEVGFAIGVFLAS